MYIQILIRIQSQLMRKEAVNFKESGEGYMGRGVVGRKWKVFKIEIFST